MASQPEWAEKLTPQHWHLPLYSPSTPFAANHFIVDFYDYYTDSCSCKTGLQVNINTLREEYNALFLFIPGANPGTRYTVLDKQILWKK